MIIMYKSIGADSKLLFRDLILIPKPAVAPVDSAAISVVSATEAPSLTAVRINGNVAGAITLDLYDFILSQNIIELGFGY